MTDALIGIAICALLFAAFGLVPHRGCTGHCPGCPGTCGRYKEEHPNDS